MKTELIVYYTIEPAGAIPAFTATMSFNSINAARLFISRKKDTNKRLGRVQYSNFVIRAAHDLNFIIERL